MAFLQGTQGKIGVPGRRIYDTAPDTPRFANIPLKDKLQTLAGYYRTADREQRIRRNTTFYLMALYYSGYQNVEMSADGNAFDVYEREDFYVENQFRRHVDAVVNMLSKAEGDVIVRPGSANPKDIAKSRAGSPILDMMKATIGYDRMRDQKNLYKALFGNAFIFVDYIVDKKYGSVVHPTFDYREMPDPEGGPDPLMSKVATGYQTRNKGSEIGLVCSPLEVHCRPDTKGFDNVPYLQWVARHDIEVLNYVYPGLGLSTGGNSIDSDSAEQYLEVLANLPGNVLGDTLAFNRSAAQVRKAELVRTWLQPCTFSGDTELERTFPDGVHVVTIDGRIVDYYAENLLDHWTHEVLIPTPASLFGDGLYDALMMQDQINELNSLLIRHMRYSTVGHKIYDATIIDPKDVVNDPANGWIPGRPTMDKNIQQAVADMRPGTLSQDVPNWLGTVKAAMQDMTSAYDPSVGKGIGANTPYSQSVFLAERAQSRWQGSLAYNRPELLHFHKQLLKIAQENWVDERQRAVSDNVGAWTFQQFTQADLAGEVDLIMSNTDMMPHSRAEQIQGIQMLNELAALLPTLPPKQKLRVEEVMGMPADSNPMSTQISRVYRVIDRVKNGEPVQPLQFVDDPLAQCPVLQDFLASEEGEELQATNAQAFQQLYLYMQNLMVMSIQQAPAPQPGEDGGQPGQPGQEKPKGTPGGQPGQQGGGAKGGPGSVNQPPAQSPAPAPPVAPPSPM